MKIHLHPATAVAVAVTLLAVGGLTTAAVASSRHKPASESGTVTPAPGQTPPVADPTQTPPTADPTQSPSAGDPTPPAPGSPTQPPALTVTPAPTQSDVPALAAGQVKYVRRIWGDPKTELGVGVLAPADWPMVKLSTFEAQFTSPNKLWLLRVNGIISDERPLDAAADQKLAVLHGTPGFKLISRTTGTAKATSDVFIGMTFRHTTLTYTYTDPTRGTRLVVDRFVVIGGSTGAGFEVSTAGRPEDLAGLNVITAKATADYFRLP